jgi:hypothetical protein
MGNNQIWRDRLLYPYGYHYYRMRRITTWDDVIDDYVFGLILLHLISAILFVAWLSDKVDYISSTVAWMLESVLNFVLAFICIVLIWVGYYFAIIRRRHFYEALFKGETPQERKHGVYYLVTVWLLSIVMLVIITWLAALQR